MENKTTINVPMLENMINCAIQNKKQVRIQYTNERGVTVNRYMEPIKWMNGNGIGILTYCHVRENFRHFKLHRISRVTVTDYDYEWTQGA